MKRSLAVFAMAGVFALMLTPKAFAICTGLSGNFAVLMQGGMPITGDATVPLTPPAPQPAPVAAIGAIQLNSSTCTITGELIVSSGGGILSTLGDSATYCGGPGVSNINTPATPMPCCTDVGTGTCAFVSSPWGPSGDPVDSVPGFNGSTNTLAGSYTFLGKNAGNQGTMTFTDSNSGLTFNFNFVLAGTTILGVSTSTSTVGADPVLSLRAEKQARVSLKQSLGNHALACTGSGTTSVASVAAGPQVLGGTLDVLAVNDTTVTSAGGVITLNLNEDWMNLSSDISSPAITLLCDILASDGIFTCPGLFPDAPVTQENCPHYDTFASGPWPSDGTADISSTLQETMACPFASLPLNLQTSQVPWGSANQNYFGISTGLDSFSVAPGTVTTCLAKTSVAGNLTLSSRHVTLAATTSAPKCSTLTLTNNTGAGIPIGPEGSSGSWTDTTTLTGGDGSLTIAADNCGNGTYVPNLSYWTPSTSPPTPCSPINTPDATDCGLPYGGPATSCTTTPSDPFGIASCWSTGGVCDGGTCTSMCNNNGVCSYSAPYAFGPVVLMPSQNCTVSVCCSNTGTPGTGTATLQLAGLLPAGGNAQSYFVSNNPNAQVSFSCTHH